MARPPVARREIRNLLLLLVMAAVLPKTGRATPVEDFQIGMEAYRAGDYAVAAQSFERARANGLDRPALDYNLGSTYYRLGEYGHAADSFERLLAVDSLRALAHYNLGLVRQQQGRHAVARYHFRAAYELTDDQRLRYLARRQVDGSSAQVERDPHDWRAYASLAAGYDDNVNFVPTDVPTYRGDQYAETYLSGSGVFSGTRTDGFSAHASLYALKFEQESENDYNQLWLLARRNARLGAWQTYAGGFASQDYLDGDRYQRGVGVEAGASRALRANRYLNLRYVFEDLDSLDSRYDYLAGQRQELRAEYAVYEDRGSLHFAYELELNDRRDTPLESYSPIRHSLHAYVRQDLNADWRVRADASYRLSDYPDAPRLDRQDRRWRTRLSASRAITKDWRVRGQWEYVSNESNDPVRDYERNVYSLQLEWLY